MDELRKLKVGLLESIQEFKKDEGEGKINQDQLHELADAHIPIYYSDLADLLKNDVNIGFCDDNCDHPEILSVFDMIQVHIFDVLMGYAMEYGEIEY